MTKPNQIITDYIVGCLKKGMSTGKIVAEVGRKWHKSERSAARLLKVAKEQHTAEQSVIKKAVAEVDKQAAIEARKKAIMTADERKEILTKIVNGHIDIENKEPRWDPKQQKFVSLAIISKSTIREMTQAIAELNKMEGDYATTKLEVDIKSYSVTLNLNA